MDDLLSEKEQIEQMRAWWSDYGFYVIGGVILGAGLLFGWNHMQTTERNAEIAASNLYRQLTDIVVDARVEEAEDLLDQLVDEYPDSSYTAQSRLAMARLYMDENRDQDAADALRAMIDGNVTAEFKTIGQIRLAKILLYQDKADEVVTLLAGLEEGAFAARAADVLGDAYVLLGRNSEAREAYQRALAETGNAATVNQQFVQYKLLDLPEEADDDMPAELPDAGTEDAVAEDAAGTEDALAEDAAGAENEVVAADDTVAEEGEE